MKYLLLVAFCFILFTSALLAQSESTRNTGSLYVVGHAHMDPVYRWRWNEIRDREIYKTFSDVLVVLDDYQDLQFAQSSLLYYATIQDQFPILFERVKKSIRDGRWSVVGGQWVETDETMPSGESLIRQFLVSQDYYSNQLGIEEINIAWSPDVFTGHPGTLPKIYAGCGIDNYVFSRAAPKDKRVFWWEATDGSRVLAYKIPGHYNPNFGELHSDVEQWVSTTHFDSPMITFGKGDHGGGPGVSDLNALSRISKDFQLDIKHISPEFYFEKLNEAKIDWPVQTSEFGYEGKGRWKGCYSSQAKIKKLNRHYENKLMATEKFLTIGTMHKGKPFFPRQDFLEAWKILVFNQFHDIIPGTITGLAANDVLGDYERLENISSELLNAGLENMGNRINTSKIEGIPIVVYNPHSWPVTQSVEIALMFVKAPAQIDIIDNEGKSVPFSLLERSADQLKYKLMLQASEVSPLGYSVYQVIEAEAVETETDLKIGENQIENSRLIVKWDTEGITSLFSKSENRELIKGSANQLKLLEDNGNSWSLNLTGREFEVQTLEAPEIIFTSARRVVVKWEDYYQSSKFTRFMTVKANSEQVDFEMEVDWQSHNKLLRLVFPTDIANGQAYYDQPYGYVNREEAEQEYPAQKWIDYSNTSYGLSLINNGKYGFTIDDGTMTMSVVRGARDMDPRMDEGKHSFKYALVAHSADWREADIPLRAWEFNQPLMAKQENHHPGEITGWRFSGESFPLKKSFFSIDSDHVIISSLKTRQDAYNPNPLILRIVETEGSDATTTVQLPYPAVSVVETNHLEQPLEEKSEIKIEGNQFSFKMGHDQIRTFMVHF